MEGLGVAPAQSGAERASRCQGLILAWLVGSALLALPVHARKALQVGDLPPDYLGRASTGGKVNLGDHRGKVVIISFWASWCTPCRNELSILAAIQKNATRDKLEVFAVNWKESPARYRAILKALKDVDEIGARSHESAMAPAASPES